MAIKANYGPVSKITKDQLGRYTKEQLEEQDRIAGQLTDELQNAVKPIVKSLFTSERDETAGKNSYTETDSHGNTYNIKTDKPVVIQNTYYNGGGKNDSRKNGESKGFFDSLVRGITNLDAVDVLFIGSMTVATAGYLSVVDDMTEGLLSEVKDRALAKIGLGKYSKQNMKERDHKRYIGINSLVDVQNSDDKSIYVKGATYISVPESSVLSKKGFSIHLDSNRIVQIESNSLVIGPYMVKNQTKTMTIDSKKFKDNTQNPDSFRNIVNKISKTDKDYYDQIVFIEKANDLTIVYDVKIRGSALSFLATFTLIEDEEFINKIENAGFYNTSSDDGEVVEIPESQIEIVK